MPFSLSLFPDPDPLKERDEKGGEGTSASSSSELELVVVGDFAPKLAAFWVHSQEGRLTGVFLESGTPAENEALGALATARPPCTAEALRKAGTPEAALALLAEGMAAAAPGREG